MAHIIAVNVTVVKLFLFVYNTKYSCILKRTVFVNLKCERWGSKCEQTGLDSITISANIVSSTLLLGNIAKCIAAVKSQGES